MKKALYFLTVISIAAAIMLTGCFKLAATPAPQPGQPSAPPAAQFTVASIDVSPQPVSIGKAFTVSAKVSNTGGVSGSYKADLFVDGKSADSQTVTVNAGQTMSVTFQSVSQVAGHHIIGVGNRTLDVTVSDNRIPLTIKLDSGQMDGCDPVAEGVSNPAQMIVQVDGAMIKLTAPPGGLTITGITMYGLIKDSTNDFNRDPVIGGPGQWVYGPDIAMAEQVRPDFSINIYGDRRNKLYSGSYSKDVFSAEAGKVTLPVQNVNVTGDFYIEVLPYNLPKLGTAGAIAWDYDIWHRYVVHTWYHQLCIGYSSAVDIQSSVSEGGSVVPQRYLSYNWMIRAEGYQTGQ